MTILRELSPGQRIRIIKQHPRGISGGLMSEVIGVVQRFGQAKTGSWYAHSRDGKLWLDRVELRKDDGELVICNLDQYCTVEVVS